ncbi:hypothetical protein ACIQUL_29905 [Streptomyces sp. NPDC090303]|uniref:hypothetical protein n=1 Tax=Streptomyces sp. NPDC090303 TaxID=3365960 RepID=UPI003830FBAA
MSEKSLQHRLAYGSFPHPQTSEEVSELLQRAIYGIDNQALFRGREKAESEFWLVMKGFRFDRVLRTFPGIDEAMHVLFEGIETRDFDLQAAYIKQMTEFIEDHRTAGSDQNEKKYPGHQFLMTVENDRSRDKPYAGDASRRWRRMPEEEQSALIRSSPQMRAWALGMRAFSASQGLTDQSSLHKHVLSSSVSDIVVLSADPHVMAAMGEWERLVAKCVEQSSTSLEDFYESYRATEEQARTALRKAHPYINERVQLMEKGGPDADDVDYFEEDRKNGVLYTGTFAAYWEGLNGQAGMGIPEFSDHEFLTMHTPQVKQWAENKKVWDAVSDASGEFQDHVALRELLVSSPLPDLERIRSIPELVTALGREAVMLETLYLCEADPGSFCAELETPEGLSREWRAWLLVEPRVSHRVVEHDDRTGKPYNGAFGTSWDMLTDDERMDLLAVPTTYTWAVGKSAWDASNGFEDKAALFAHLAASPAEDTLRLVHEQKTLQLMGEGARHLIDCISACMTDPAAFYREYQRYEHALQLSLRTCPVIDAAMFEMAGYDVD